MVPEVSCENSTQLLSMRIAGKFAPHLKYIFILSLRLGYLFTTDSNLQRIFNDYRHSIDSLTFSLETCVVPSEMSAYPKQDQLILTSILNNKCSVGISTDVPVQLVDIHERNKKKLAKLQANLIELQERISSEKYRRKTKSHRKERDLHQVSSFVNKHTIRIVPLSSFHCTE